MSSICIIADNAAQFTRVNFPENVCLRFINHKTEFSFASGKDRGKSGSNSFPKFLEIDQAPVITTPAKDELHDLLDSSLNSFDDVFILLHSGEMNPGYTRTTNLLRQIKGRAQVHLIDTQTLSVGQGHLIQTTIDLASKGMTGNQIEQSLRELVPHIYTVLCSPNLSYLKASNNLDVGQCIVGEMQSLLPVFNLEDGKLIPVDKMRNIHAVIDYFIEYIDEFDNLQHVAFLQPTPALLHEYRLIKQYLEEKSTSTMYTEHTHNNFLASLIGPAGFGLILIEGTN